MLCDNCKKNEATIHIKEVHDGKITTSNLCGDCAKAKEEKGELGSLGFNLAEVFFNLGKLRASLQPKVETRKENGSALVCSSCGWTLEKLRNNSGRLGCPDCYRTFAPMIAEALTRIQRGPVHLGKRPPCCGSAGTAALEFELEQQKHELDEHVRREDYEAAAICRDRISQLKTELEAQKKAPDSPEEEQPEKEAEHE